MTIRQLEYLIAVIDEGSVSGAARRLHVSPGAVSQAVTDIEATLGVQLTIRRPAKGVAATPAGRAAVARARTIVDKTAELRDLAQELRGELHGPLRIGCFTTLSPWVLPPIAALFARHFPGVALDLVDGPSDELQEQVLTGGLDAALILLRHVMPGVEPAEIVPLRLQLLLPSDHRLTAMEAVPLREVQDEPAILIDLQPARGLVEEMLRASGFEPRVRWRFRNVETIRSMVARGLGYSAIMGRPIGDRTYDGLPVAYRRIADQMPHNGLTVVYPKQTRPTAKVRSLITFCRQEFTGEDEQLAQWQPTHSRRRDSDPHNPPPSGGRLPRKRAGNPGIER